MFKAYLLVLLYDPWEYQDSSYLKQCDPFLNHMQNECFAIVYPIQLTRTSPLPRWMTPFLDEISMMSIFDVTTLSSSQENPKANVKLPGLGVCRSKIANKFVPAPIELIINL